MTGFAISDDGGDGEHTGYEEVDLRLAGPAALSWLLVGLGQFDQRTTLWFCAAGLIATGSVLIAVLRRGRAARRSLIIHLLAVCSVGVAVCSLSLVRAEARAGSPVTAAAEQGRPITIEATVSAAPRPARAGNGLAVLPVTVHTARVGGRNMPLDRPVLVIGTGAELLALRAGQAVSVSGTARPARLPADVDAVIVSARLTAVGDRVARWRVASDTIRSSLAAVAEQSVGGNTSGLLVAMVDGDVSGIGPITISEFRAAGLAHLLAVSGANVAIVLGAVLWLLRRCGAPFPAQMLGCCAALVAFVAVTGPEPSVLRAAGMGVVLLIGLAGGRPRASLPALCAAVTVLLWALPQLATSIGFALSVSATAGIILMAPPLADRIAWLPRWLALPCAVSTAALLATLPLTVVLQPRINALAVVANILAVAVVPPITVLGVIAAVCAPWAQPVAAMACHLAAPLVRWIELVATRCADAGAWRIDWPGGLLGGVLVVLAILAGVGVWRVAARLRYAAATVLAVVLGVGVLAVPLRYSIGAWPPEGWLIASCDVGQGDATLIRTSPDEAVLVDTGPDPPSAERCLDAFGIDSVAVLVLTHFHSDHVGGTDAVLGRRPVGTVLITRLDGADTEAALRGTAATAAVPVREASAGEVWHAGPVRIVVLGPVRPVLGTDSDPNNNSLVLRVETGGISLLLPGDAEQEEQRQLTRVDGLDVDVLKVPHHGSAVQHEPFLAATSPQVALVSAGRDNSYGHPAAVTLGRLAALHTAVYRTDQSGDIAIVMRDRRMEVLTRPVADADRS